MDLAIKCHDLIACQSFTEAFVNGKCKSSLTIHLESLNDCETILFINGHTR